MGSMSAAPVDRKARGALSPSRAADFLSCPLLFRYRTIDRLAEGSSADAVRGTLVHQVLEDIFDLPAAERTPAAAHTLLEPTWAELQARSPGAREVAASLAEPAWPGWGPPPRAGRRGWRRPPGPSAGGSSPRPRPASSRWSARRTSR